MIHAVQEAIDDAGMTDTIVAVILELIDQAG